MFFEMIDIIYLILFVIFMGFIGIILGFRLDRSLKGVLLYYLIFGLISCILIVIFFVINTP